MTPRSWLVLFILGMSVSGFAQQKEFLISVTDVNGLALSGAKVKVESRVSSAIIEAIERRPGTYEITIDEMEVGSAATVVVSARGYETRSIDCELDEFAIPTVTLKRASLDSLFPPIEEDSREYLNHRFHANIKNLIPTSLILQVTGPKELRKGTRGSFVIRIKPEQGHPIRDFSLALAASAGYLRIQSGPSYVATTQDAEGGNSLVEIKVKDLPENQRKMLEWSKISGEVIAGLFPPVAFFMGVGNALSSTANLISSDEPDWMGLWDYTARYDHFTITKPEMSTPPSPLGTPYRFTYGYTIEIPFEVLKDVGTLDLFVNTINVHPEDVSSFSVGATYTEPRPFHLVKATRPILHSEHVSVSEFTFKTEVSLESHPVIVEVSSSYRDGRLVVELVPVSATSSPTRFEDMSLGLVFPKQSARITGIPVFYDQANTVLPWKSERMKQAEAALMSWIGVGITLLPGGNMTKAIEMAKDAHGLWTGFNSVHRSVAFSEGIENLWRTENEYDIFQLPTVENKRVQASGAGGIRVDIPMHIDAANTFEVLALAKLSYSTPIGQTSLHAPKSSEISLRIPVTVNDPDTPSKSESQSLKSWEGASWCMNLGPTDWLPSEKSLSHLSFQTNDYCWGEVRLKEPINEGSRFTFELKLRLESEGVNGDAAIIAVGDEWVGYQGTSLGIAFWNDGNVYLWDSRKGGKSKKCGYFQRHEWLSISIATSLDDKLVIKGPTFELSESTRHFNESSRIIMAVKDSEDGFEIRKTSR